MKNFLLVSIFLLPTVAVCDSCTSWYIERADGVNNICMDSQGNTWLHDEGGTRTFPGDTVSNEIKQAIAEEEGRAVTGADVNDLAEAADEEASAGSEGAEE